MCTTTHLMFDQIKPSLYGCALLPYTCIQIGQKVMHAPHLVHMHWCPQSRHTVFVALRAFANASSERSEKNGTAIHVHRYRGNVWRLISITREQQPQSRWESERSAEQCIRLPRATINTHARRHAATSVMKPLLIRVSIASACSL